MVMGSLTAEAGVVVIGGGPGGYAAAFRAADLGLDVAVVNQEERPGGVCLLRGCIPSKALLHLAELLFMTREARAAGLKFEEPEVNLEQLREWKDKVVGGLAKGLESIFRKREIELYQAVARFESDRRLHLQAAQGGDDVPDALEFEQAIIATGSRPVALPGVEFRPDGRIMDSAMALELPDIPKSLLVVGGGYVGLEMGMVYSALGSKVTVAEMTGQLMPNADSDLVEPLAKRLKEEFEEIRLETKVAGMEESGENVKVELERGGETAEETFERVLVAVGRKPNSEEIGLDAIGVEAGEHGFIPADEGRRTQKENIFAVGDVTGGFMLAHEAMHEGRVAAEVIGGQAAAFDARATPAVVYTDPQVAWCGLTEREAKEQGRDVEIARFPWKASGRAQSMGAPRGLTKLILDPGTKRVLGAGITGRQAEALIAEAALAIEMGAVAEDLAYTIHPHPTLSETLGEAAELFLGSPTHLAGKK